MSGSNQKGKSKQRHGLSHTKLYKVFGGMKQRCYYPKHVRYYAYGGKGVTICDEWLTDFKSFYDWAYSNGYKDGLTIDRIDNSKGYSPDNCRWVTPKEQVRNMTCNHNLTINGETKCMSEWCEIYGTTRDLVKTRIKLGWDAETALTKPKRGIRKHGNSN